MSPSSRAATCPKCGHSARLAACVLCGGGSPLVPREQCPRCKGWGFVVRCAPCEAAAAEEARAASASARGGVGFHARPSAARSRRFSDP